MKDDVFIDTNLLIYLYSEKGKGGKIRELVDEHFENIVISTQVLGEFFHIITKKRFKDKSEAKEIVVEMTESFRVVPIKQTTVISAIDLHKWGNPGTTPCFNSHPHRRQNRFCHSIQG